MRFYRILVGSLTVVAKASFKEIEETLALVAILREPWSHIRVVRVDDNDIETELMDGMF